MTDCSFENDGKKTIEEEICSDTEQQEEDSNFVNSVESLSELEVGNNDAYTIY